MKFSPPLADKFALNTAHLSTAEIALKVIEIVRPDIYVHLRRRQLWQEMKASGKSARLRCDEVKLGPIRHNTLPDGLLVRIKLIHYIFSDVLSDSLGHDINLYRREVYPNDEIAVWEKIAVSYLEALAYLTNKAGNEVNLETKKEVVSVLLGFTIGFTDEETAHSFENLSYEDVARIGEYYLHSVPEIPEGDE